MKKNQNASRKWHSPLAVIVIIGMAMLVFVSYPAAAIMTSNPRPVIKVSFNESVAVHNVSLLRVANMSLINVSRIQIDELNRTFAFTPTTDLREGNYIFTLHAKDSLGNIGKTEQPFAVNFSFYVTLESPPYGKSQSNPFEIEFASSQNATCRYNYLVPSLFSLHQSFDETGKRKHVLYAFNISNPAYGGLMFVICNSSNGRMHGEFGAFNFSFTIDNTAPSIQSLDAYPNPVIECVPLQQGGCEIFTTLRARTNEPTRCKYHEAGAGRLYMNYSFMQGRFDDREEYSTDNTAKIIFSEQGEKAFYVSCEDQTWPALVTATHNITIRINVSLPLSLVLLTPQNLYHTNSTIDINASTNKLSNCIYATDSGTVFAATGPSSIHFARHTTNRTGTQGITITCTRTGENATASLTFTIDKTPPVFLYVNDSSQYSNPEKTYNNRELKIRFRAQDPESGIGHYKYRIESQNGSAVIDWTTTTDDDFKVHDLNLRNGTYKFRINATNNAGLSSSSLSDGITVDTSYQPQPTCSDGIKNQDELGVDCGGVCSAKCRVADRCNSNTDCQSGFCNTSAVNKTCIANPCSNNAFDTWSAETDIDCGGAICLALNKTCQVDKKCNADRDCASGYCNVLKVCVTPSCTDRIKNGLESDIDCGGNCPKCNETQICRRDSDCKTNYCGISLKCACLVNDRNCDGTVERNETAPDRNRDTDSDGLPDWYELEHGLDPNRPDSSKIDVATGKTWIEVWRDIQDPRRRNITRNTSEPPIPQADEFSFITLVLAAALIGIAGGGGYFVYTKYYKKSPSKNELFAQPVLRSGNQVTRGPAGPITRSSTISQPPIMQPRQPQGQTQRPSPRPIPAAMKEALRKKLEERSKSRVTVFDKFAGQGAARESAKPSEKVSSDQQHEAKKPQSSDEGEWIEIDTVRAKANAEKAKTHKTPKDVFSEISSIAKKGGSKVHDGEETAKEMKNPTPDSDVFEELRKRAKSRK